MLKIFRLCQSDDMPDPKREMLREFTGFLNFLLKDHNKEMTNLWMEMQGQITRVEEYHAEVLRRSKAEMRAVLLRKEAKIVELKQELEENKAKLLDLKSCQDVKRELDSEHQAFNDKDKENSSEESDSVLIKELQQKVLIASENTQKAVETLSQKDSEVSSLCVVIEELKAKLEAFNKTMIEKSPSEKSEPEDQPTPESNTCASETVDEVVEEQPIHISQPSLKKESQKEPIKPKSGTCASVGADKPVKKLTIPAPKSSTEKSKPKEQLEAKTDIYASEGVDSKKYGQKEASVFSRNRRVVPQSAFLKDTSKRVAAQDSLIRQMEGQKMKKCMENFLEAKKKKEQSEMTGNKIE